MRVALLGTGNVGTAVIERLGQWSGTRLGQALRLVHVANSRQSVSCIHGISSIKVKSMLRRGHAGVLDATAPALLGDGTRIVIDATASHEVAARHAQWLAEGIHVVTACKLAQGGPLTAWQSIREACSRGGTRYGDSATVGAGLPLLRTVRELQAGGDRIHAIAGVLSGSLAWLLDHYDGVRPFSELLRQARSAGYTEPDARDDLSGEDVRRKLLILGRAAGVPLEVEDVDVQSLVPNDLRALPVDGFDAAMEGLDAPLQERHAAACNRGETLHFIARLDIPRWPTSNLGNADRPSARVGLESLPHRHPLATGAGTDNRVAIWSDRYCERPLVIQGAGAGADVTAAALLDDVLRISALLSGEGICASA
ncbi:MAG: homoserine dehydrogenase [Pseudomonadota bacterium]|nr:homoserine dehydrogenase [Pseudomonadota bacterium]